MSKIISAISIVVLLLNWSCSSNDEAALPSAPASVKAVQAELKGKAYKVVKAGTHSLISTDKEITWLELKENEKFEKGIVDDSKSTHLNFVNDTAVTVLYKGKKNEGTYKVDDVTGEDEKPGIKLHISYVDDEFKFGDGAPMKVTYTYLIEGISSKNLLLETPRTMNDRKIVVLMSKE
jgi:hypothetical protein